MDGTWKMGVSVSEGGARAGEGRAMGSRGGEGSRHPELVAGGLSIRNLLKMLKALSEISGQGSPPRVVPAGAVVGMTGGIYWMSG